MTKDELKIKVSKCFENSEKILIERGELMPMLDIEFLDDKGEKSIIAVILAIGDDKVIRDKFIKGLGLIFGFMKRVNKIKEAECIVMMSEAWFSSPSKQDYDNKNYKMPSEDPNKREMLCATGLSINGDCLMQAKEMFSIEVKGKRHFTLADLPEMKDSGFEKATSNVLNNFFDGYKKSTEDSGKNQILDLMFSKVGDMTLDEILKKSINILTQQVGGLNSEFINPNK